jgi:FkbM family methyltransferase
MHLSDFLFFTITLSVLAIMGILSMWDHVGKTTDWENRIHSRVRNSLERTEERPKKLAAAAPPPEPTVHSGTPMHKIEAYNCSGIVPSGDFAQTKTRPPFRMYIHPVSKDIHVSGLIKRQGVWEAAQISLFTKFLTRYRDALFVDVGLNIGMYSLVAVARKHRTIAFEPLQLNLDRVCSSVNYNKFKNLTIYPFAITNASTKVSFRTPKDNAGGTEVYDNDNLDGTENIDFAYGYPFDSFNISYNGPIIMKIDIEGHECQMFQHIEKFFEKNDVRLVMIEWGQLAKHCGNKVADILLTHGLNPYDDSGTKPFDVAKKPWKGQAWDMVWKKPFN